MNFMEEAIKCAKEAKDVPVGAVVVWQDRIVEKAVNGEKPYEHAEMVAIREAYNKIGENIRDAFIYVTLEPCVMCCGLIALVKLKRVYFGAYDPKYGATATAFNLTTHKPEVYGGLCEEACSSLLKDFFYQKRLL